MLNESIWRKYTASELSARDLEHLISFQGIHESGIDRHQVSTFFAQYEIYELPEVVVLDKDEIPNIVDNIEDAALKILLAESGFKGFYYPYMDLSIVVRDYSMEALNGYGYVNSTFVEELAHGAPNSNRHFIQDRRGIIRPVFTGVRVHKRTEAGQHNYVLEEAIANYFAAQYLQQTQVPSEILWQTAGIPEAFEPSYSTPVPITGNSGVIPLSYYYVDSTRNMRLDFDAAAAFVLSELMAYSTELTEAVRLSRLGIEHSNFHQTLRHFDPLFAQLFHGSQRDYSLLSSAFSIIVG